MDNVNRPKFIPLFEENENYAAIGEIIINPWTGHVSTKNPQGQIVSATKALATKVTTIENALKDTPNATSLNALLIREEFILVDANTQVDPVDQKQVFFLNQGKYELGLNRIEVFIGAARFSAAKGNLTEVSENSFKLTENMPEGTVLEIKYFEVIKNPNLAYGLNVLIQDTQPDTSDLSVGTLWIYSDSQID